MPSAADMASNAATSDASASSAVVGPGLSTKLAVNSNKFMQKLSTRIAGDDNLAPTSSVINAFDSLHGGHANAEGDRRQFVPVSLTWKDVTYIVPVRVGKSLRKKGKKTVLDGIGGHLPTGRLLAVMGPTGCGKTSLLNVLAGRLPSGGSVSGEILVNGQPRTKAFRNLSAYVMQDDVLFSNLTVRETLRVAADLRLPSSLPSEKKAAVVEDIIAELGLVKCANTWIGNELIRGISGGERKRTAVAVELLSNPSLICADEPTSGLDAFQAQNVMESLTVLARHGRTVMCTIHQPRSSIYSMFDLLLLLSEGKVMYGGPAKDAVTYFASRGFPCPEHFNPADFFLDVVSMDYRGGADNEQDCRQRIIDLANTYKQREAQVQVVATHQDSLAGVKSEFRFANGWPWQFYILCKRAFTQNSRDMFAVFFGFVVTTFVAVLLGIIYLQIDHTQAGIQDTAGILFFVAIFSVFSNFQPVLDVFPVEMKVVQRERAAKSYRVLPYYISKVIAETPLRLITTLLFSSIVYWMAGLNPGASNFFIFWTIAVLVALTAIAFGLCLSALIPNTQAAMAISPVFLIFIMLFAGFFASVSSMPAWLAWIKWCSFLYYAYSGLLVNEFRNQCCWECDKECLQFDDVGRCTLRGTADAGGCLRTGNQILERFGLDDWPLWATYAGLGAALVIYHVLGYTFLRMRKAHFLELPASGPTGQAPSRSPSNAELNKLD